MLSSFLTIQYQHLLTVRNPSCTPLWFWIWIGYRFLSISWWLDGLKNNRENYPRKCFWTKEKETRVKFNPGLSANRPSNNWAQGFQEVCRPIPSSFSRSVRRGKVVTWLQNRDVVRGNVKRQLWESKTQTRVLFLVESPKRNSSIIAIVCLLCLLQGYDGGAVPPTCCTVSVLHKGFRNVSQPIWWSWWQTMQILFLCTTL